MEILYEVVLLLGKIVGSILLIVSPIAFTVLYAITTKKP